MTVTDTPLQLIATCAFGLESIVRRELQALGYTGKVVSPGRVQFEGDYAAIARTNVWLRCSDRVLVVMGTFPAADFDALFDTVREMPWENWLGIDAAFPVIGRSAKSTLTSVPAIQRSVKKAMVMRMQQVYRRDVLAETDAQYKTEIAILEDQATVTIDTTGPSLHKRGYRLRAGEAPIKETMAAALVMLSFWKGDRPMIDPFVGSGTIPIEAAMIARSMAPGRHRRFAASDWPQLPAYMWSEVFTEADDLIQPELTERIIGTDVDERTLAGARHNAEAALVGGSVHFQARPFDQLTSAREYGCVITNPPYGERIGDDWELRPLYESMPTVLAKLPTWSHYILTAYPNFERLVGRNADRRRKLYNGRIECCYYQYHGPKRPKRRPRPDADGVSTQTAGSNISPTPSVADLLASLASGVEFASVTHPITEVTPVEPIAITQLESVSCADTVPASTTTVQNPISGQEPSGIDEHNEPATPELHQTPDVAPPSEASVTSLPTEPNSQPASDQTTAASADTPTSEVTTAEEAEPVHANLWRTNPTDLPPVFGRVETKTDELADLFARRLTKLAKHLRRYPTRKGITSYRLYERDVAEVPLVVDRYEDHLHLIEYDRPHARNDAQHERWLDRMAITARDTLGIDPGKVFLKRKSRQRGTSQHEQVDDQQIEVVAHEGGLKFLVNLSDYVDTGLFLDHRITRSMVREEAAGKSFLNLFAYTGSFSVYAAHGGAASTTTVDWSNTYLQWAKRNFTMNRLDGPQHEFARMGTLEFLHTHRPEPTYDLCVVDPPTFSNSKRTEDVWDVQHSYIEMFEQLLPLMKPGGVIYFSTNFRRFKMDESQINVSECYEISRQTVPPEYRNQRIHRCWKMVV